MTPPPTRRAPSNGRSSLSADLLSDLNAPGALPTSTPPAAAAAPVRTGGTPALSMTLTPLRWRAPGVTPAERGVGVALRVGPLRVEVAF